MPAKIAVPEFSEIERLRIGFLDFSTVGLNGTKSFWRPDFFSDSAMIWSISRSNFGLPGVSGIEEICKADGNHVAILEIIHPATFIFAYHPVSK